MPSARSIASSAPRSPLASATSAAFTSRNFSDAVNCRRVLLGTDSCDELLTLRAGCLPSPSAGTSSRLRTSGDFGTLGKPFSAHRYKDIGKRLSQATLAHRGRPHSSRNRRLYAQGLLQRHARARSDRHRCVQDRQRRSWARGTVGHREQVHVHVRRRRI